MSAATPAPDPRDGPADGDVRVAAVRRLHEQDRPRPPEAGPEKLPPGID